ncbi:alpha-galactosidase [Paenibacillus montanisoli]|uniref:Alpha-galactosidase n=1 Tax=Paenibacillus montanisoli TaxID=2081970 RepID=A0A328U2T8_9BACL|nr:alpha-galactosidase [Paenibacillus montanisoli]RAP77010.1 alpha-galactosidase [Paenibacillus montanisoli]
MIRFDEQRSIWVMETNTAAYAIGLCETGTVNHVYFGEKLPFLSDYPCAEIEAKYPYTLGSELSAEEFMGWSKAKYTEPCLKATFADQVRDAVLEYRSWSVTADTLTIVLKDQHYPLSVQLSYKLYEDLDIIERTAVIVNEAEYSITLEAVLSGSTFVPKNRNYRLGYLTGKWVGETQFDQMMLPTTKVVLESRRGTTSHFANPFYTLDPDGLATEMSGEVYFGALAFSGNWKITLERDHFGLLKVSAGVNDFDFCWDLKPQSSFVTPSFYIGYSNAGFGEASRKLHQLQLEHLLPAPARSELRKVLYNSWDATYFDFNEELQSKLAKEAASIGVELFVIDDGWFGKRMNDKAGLGDWYVNSDKFPRGLNSLIEKVNALGMDFGLWVEPEMVNPDSDLYRAHPEWVYHFPTRQRTEIRNQLVLNLAREDVRHYIYSFMDELLSKHPITFIKWDMNRNFSEPGYPEAPVSEQREIWVRHALGVYEIVKRLKERHPDVLFQSCSGGGGRVDLGIIQYFDQVWTSDNTDAYDRLRIQEGFSFAYCAKIMEAWVSDEVHPLNQRKLSLKYRFHSAMMGNLGIGVNLTKWSDSERAEARELIELYKRIRPTVQHGDQYRLLSPRDNEVSATMYVNRSKNEAVVFAFLRSNSYGNTLPKLRLAGLEDHALYSVEGEMQAVSGKALKQIGIKLNLVGDYDSTVIRICKVG